MLITTYNLQPPLLLFSPFSPSLLSMSPTFVFQKGYKRMRGNKNIEELNKLIRCIGMKSMINGKKIL